MEQKTIGVPCPNCTECEVVERRSKKGKTFFGCNRYPVCDFVAWGKPIQEKCPDCGSSYLIEKWLKAGRWRSVRTASASLRGRMRPNFAQVDSLPTVNSIPSIKVDRYLRPKTKLSFYWGDWREDVSKNLGDGLPLPISSARYYKTRTNTYRLVSVAVEKGTEMAAKWHPAGGAVRSEPFPLIRRRCSERPGAVKGAPLLGAAKRTLDGEDRSEKITEEGKAGAKAWRKVGRHSGTLARRL